MTRTARTLSLSCLVLLALACPSAAGPPGKWTRITGKPNPDAGSLEVGLARTPNGVLNVLWSQDKTVFNSQISANAKTVSGPNSVFTYQNGASGALSLLLEKGGLRAFFAGLYPMHPLDVGLATATSADGKTWSVQPTLASDGRPGKRAPVYVAAGIGGTITKSGVPISIWGDSAPGAAGYHVGTSDQTSDVHFGGPSATAGGPNAATDSVTGQVAIGWNDLDSGRTLVQSISPAGPRLRTPGGRAADAVERVGMTGRTGGKKGIYVAFLSGTNFFSSRPAVWRVGAPDANVLAGRGARWVGLAAGTEGRLWAFWAKSTTTWRIFAKRSNKQATRFGSAVRLKPPSGNRTVYSLEGEGTAPGGALDLLALTEQGSKGDTANFHQRVLPALTLRAQVLEQGKVVLTVLDAGDPINAKVTFAGNSAMTGADGKLTMFVNPGRYRAKAARSGYTPTTRKVKVKQ